MYVCVHIVRTFAQHTRVNAHTHTHNYEQIRRRRRRVVFEQARCKLLTPCCRTQTITLLAAFLVVAVVVVIAIVVSCVPKSIQDIQHSTIYSRMGSCVFYVGISE